VRPGRPVTALIVRLASDASYGTEDDVQVEIEIGIRPPRNRKMRRTSLVTL